MFQLPTNNLVGDEAKTDQANMRSNNLDESQTGQKILQFGFPRTGSTVVWNILNELFGDNSDPNQDKWTNPDVVKKSHNLNDLASYLNAGHKIVITLREPLSCVKSRVRVDKNFAGFDKECISYFLENPDEIDQYLIGYTSTHKTIIDILQKYKEKSRQICFVRYKHVDSLENGGLDSILDGFERFFGLTDQIDQKVKDSLLHQLCKVNVVKNMPSKKFKEFYDPQNQFHGQHISTGNESTEVDRLLKKKVYFRNCQWSFDYINGLLE